MSEALTTEDLLDQGEERTGLLRGQLLMMVAKSAAVRHVATHEHADRFVLKGGTLLTHVYDSPRQSIADADYFHLDGETLTTVELERAFTVTQESFALEADFAFREPASFEGSAVFDIDAVNVRSAPSRRYDRRPALKVTISIRPGEWLDPHGQELHYRDPLLAGDDRFVVQGLSLEELAAEKILGWCTKDLAKHMVDLAYVQREFGDSLDYEKIGSLVRRKFAAERGQGRYRMLGIDGLGKLGPRFGDQGRIDQVIHRDWARLGAEGILFLPKEAARTEQSLTVAGNVVNNAQAFWECVEPHIVRP